jgi:hypothetical protein
MTHHTKAAMTHKSHHLSQGAETSVEGERSPDEGGEEHVKRRTREKRLLCIVAILVVSWLIVKVWADVFETFVRKVLGIDKDRFVANAIVAVIFTIVIVWLLYVTEVDDMLSS